MTILDNHAARYKLIYSPNLSPRQIGKICCQQIDCYSCINSAIKMMEEKKNIVGKGENAGYQHFLLFSQCFLRPSQSGS